MRNIIGRINEQETLKKRYDSDRAEFVALYGRRRVGKTFLIKSLFEHDFAFYATGINDGDTSRQLANFNNEIANYGGKALTAALNWFDAFENLNTLIKTSPNTAKKVIFLDEISWMATPKSDFLPALDYFWNRWMSSRSDILLVICGSATSWIIDNIVNNTGGLHNRLTQQIRLGPFSLKECEEYYRDRGIPLPRFQILESFMVFGGIPYYMDFFEADRSLAQNIDRAYFAQDAPLRSEFDNLYRALFLNADRHIEVIEAMSSKRKGLTREEITKITKIKGGGTLTKILSDLVSCGFVREYYAFGKRKRDRMFQLTDPFTLFHLTFADKQKRFEENYWLNFCTTPAHSAWSGFAFERACLMHLPQIKHALGISGVLTEASSWQSKSSDPGAQIDLVLERSDRIIHLCEMKFSSDEYTIDKAYSKKLRAKKSAFHDETATRKAAHTTLVTTFGLKRNEYSAEILFQITMNDLF
jgi:predicted AAA+ superfamily ATPase